MENHLFNPLAPNIINTATPHGAMLKTPNTISCSSYATLLSNLPFILGFYRSLWAINSGPKVLNYTVNS